MSDKKNKLLTVQKIISYGPLVVTVLVLLIQTFVPSLLISLPLTSSIAILVGSTILLIWHAETTMQNLKEEQQSLKQNIYDLNDTQTKFINSTTSLSKLKLGAAFADIADKTPRVGHLRIFAISSQQILSFLKFNDITIDTCHVLLRGFSDEESIENQDFINQIKLVIADWRQLQNSGRISKLIIRNYDFFPTEYECIFDKEHLILGLYDSDPNDYSKVKVRDPVVVMASTDSGKIMISEFAERFDNFFDICESNHGANTSSLS